jgi:hypothetical protein
LSFGGVTTQGALQQGVSLLDLEFTHITVEMFPVPARREYCANTWIL